MSTNAKINNPYASPIKIVVAPLDWGLGHATRCIPIIKELINQRCEVWIAATGAQKALLQEEFPLLSFVELPGYGVKYGKNRAFTILRLLFSVPKILIRIKQEKAWLREFQAAERPDAVISDNRWGLHLPGLPSVFITHQLRIRTPLGKIADDRVQRMHYRIIRHFSRCWVPDVEGPGSLAGELSNPVRRPAIPTRYIGWLSRMERGNTGAGEGWRMDKIGAPAATGGLLVLLSGPEPQRTILEKKIAEQAAFYEGPVTLVRGLPGGKDALAGGRVTGGSRLIIHNHLPATALAALIRGAEIVIARAGYSTVMDLMKLGKKAIFIPTPGQSEQEYLGVYLAGKRLAVCIDQSVFSLKEAVILARDFPYALNDPGSGEDLLRREIRSLLEELGGSANARRSAPDRGTDQSAPDFG